MEGIGMDGAPACEKTRCFGRCACSRPPEFLFTIRVRSLLRGRRVRAWCSFVLYSSVRHNYPLSWSCGEAARSQPAFCCPRLWVAWCVRARSPVAFTVRQRCISPFSAQIRIYSVCDCRRCPVFHRLSSLNSGKIIDEQSTATSSTSLTRILHLYSVHDVAVR